MGKKSDKEEVSEYFLNVKKGNGSQVDVILYRKLGEPFISLLQ